MERERKRERKWGVQGGGERGDERVTLKKSHTECNLRVDADEKKKVSRQPNMDKIFNNGIKVQKNDEFRSLHSDR